MPMYFTEHSTYKSSTIIYDIPLWYIEHFPNSSTTFSFIQRVTPTGYTMNVSGLVINIKDLNENMLFYLTWKDSNIISISYGIDYDNIIGVYPNVKTTTRTIPELCAKLRTNGIFIFKKGLI